MDIAELKKTKKQYEQKIMELINSEINEFELNTGVRPDDIYLKLIDITRVQDTKPRWIVGNVDLEIKI